MIQWLGSGSAFVAGDGQVVKWYTQHDNDQPRPGELRLVNDEQYAERCAHQNINRWQKRIPKSFVRALCIGALFA